MEKGVVLWRKLAGVVDLVVQEDGLLAFAVWVLLDGRLCIVISLIRSIAVAVHALATYCI